jgi:uncharacterized protein
MNRREALLNPAWAVIPAFITAFIFIGMAEEFGWRGYVLPRFQAKWNALVSSLLLGGLWALWHVGEWFYRGSNLYQRNFWEWAVGMILLSIVMTWVFNNTKGSIFPAALIRALWNTGIIWHRSDWRFYGVLLLTAILIVVIFGPKDLMRHRVKTIP